MNVTQHLQRNALHSPDCESTIFGSGPELERDAGASRPPGRCAALARCRNDERVAILSLNSDRYLEYLFAVPWADAVGQPREHPLSLGRSPTHCWIPTPVLFVDDAFARCCRRCASGCRG